MDEAGGHVYVADMSGAITGEDFAALVLAPRSHTGCSKVDNIEITNEQAQEIATKAVAAMERDPGSGNGIDILTIPNLITVVSNPKKEVKG